MLAVEAGRASKRALHCLYRCNCCSSFVSHESLFFQVSCKSLRARACMRAYVTSRHDLRSKSHLLPHVHAWPAVNTETCYLCNAFLWCWCIVNAVVLTWDVYLRAGGQSWLAFMSACMSSSRHHGSLMDPLKEQAGNTCGLLTSPASIVLHS